MTDKLRQAAEMALKALRNKTTVYVSWDCGVVEATEILEEALTQALAEPETVTVTPQEIYALSKQSGINFAYDSEGDWTGLTDDVLTNRYTGKPDPEDDYTIKRTIEILEPFVRLIEARLKVNNPRVTN